MKENFKDRIYRIIYGDKWFLSHFAMSLIACLIYALFIRISNINFSATLTIISNNTISLLVSLAGFVFAGVSIFISLEGSKKMETIKSIGKANIIYNILISSIISFIFSFLFMGLDLTVFNIKIDIITASQKIIKLVLEYSSIYLLVLGFVFFLSSLKLIRWIFK